MKKRGNPLFPYYLKPDELFWDLDGSKIETSYTTIENKYELTKKELCGKVFSYFIYLVVLDVIRNNVIFEFPTYKRMCLMMNYLHGESLKSHMKRFKTKSYDLFESNFKLFSLNIVFRNKLGGVTARRVTPCKQLCREIYKRVNNQEYG